MLRNKIFQDLNVLVTGHTGFKGHWLGKILSESGANVFGLSLKPAESSLHSKINPKYFKNEYIGDIRNQEFVKFAVEEIEPSMVFHLAAQPIVIESYKDPMTTFTTNFNGTLNLLSSCERLESIQGIVVVTTDKVYKNNNSNSYFSEEDSLGGHDPYSASKACAEIATAAWPLINFKNSNIKIVTARAGNVIGGGDHAADRLLPDIFRFFENGSKAVIRNPDYVRPWQHVLDSLDGYLRIGKKILAGEEVSKSYNFGPPKDSVFTVRDICAIVDRLIPESPGFSFDELATGFKESKFLALDSTKAALELGWSNKLSTREAVEWTVNWHQLSKTLGIEKVLDSQIKEYESLE